MKTFSANRQQCSHGVARIAPLFHHRGCPQSGVSPATVSRAFNQPDIVHPDTLAHIRAIAKRAGFRPNRVGRSLRSGSTRTIGLILPTLSNPVFAECFEGAERRARESGYSVMLTATGYDPAVESAAVQGLIDHQVDGLILTVADAARSTTLDDLDSAGMPYVLVYNESAAHPMPLSTIARRPSTWFRTWPRWGTGASPS